MSVNSNILNISEGVKVGNTITKYLHHVYHPLASTRFTYNDEIRFHIHQQDIFTLPSESFLLVEGKLERSVEEGKDPPLFLQNGISFLFDEVRYEINSKEVDKTRNLGIATLMKGLVSFTKAEHKLLTNAGWNTDFNTQVMTDTGQFTVCVPLKMWLGFAEDYKKIVVGVRQELILLRSRNDNNALFSSNTSAKVEIQNISWYLPHVTVSDAAKISLMKLIDRDEIIKLPFRSWEFQENPSLSTTTRNNWTVMTTSQLEKPRYVIIGFQTLRKNNITKENDKFDHITLKDIKLYLNSESYPYSNLNLDTSINNFALLYNMYIEFQRSYYGRKDYEVILERKEFLDSQPLIVFDCNYQNDSIKTAPIDIHIEIETENNVPANTCCYCLILHDRIIQYSSLSGIVKRL